MMKGYVVKTRMNGEMDKTVIVAESDKQAQERALNLFASCGKAELKGFSVIQNDGEVRRTIEVEIH